MSFKEFLNKLYEGVGLSLMGTGEEININGEINISNKERNIYRNNVTEIYYSNLSQLVFDVISALKEAGLTASTGQEVWEGAFNGSLSDGETAQLAIDLVKDNKLIKNSRLVLNIQKDNSRNKVYELNSYLS